MSCQNNAMYTLFLQAIVDSTKHDGVFNSNVPIKK
jgi:hypothetical protein